MNRTALAFSLLVLSACGGHIIAEAADGDTVPVTSVVSTSDDGDAGADGATGTGTGTGGPFPVCPGAQPTPGTTCTTPNRGCVYVERENGNVRLVHVRLERRVGHEHPGRLLDQHAPIRQRAERSRKRVDAFGPHRCALGPSLSGMRFARSHDFAWFSLLAGEPRWHARCDDRVVTAERHSFAEWSLS